MQFDEKGREVLDQTPVEIPLTFKKPLTMQQEIQRMVRSELSRVASAQGMESFEESDDFDVDDEDDLAFVSPYEIMEMRPDGPAETLDGLATEGAPGAPEPNREAQAPAEGSAEPGVPNPGQGADDRASGAGMASPGA